MTAASSSSPHQTGHTGAHRGLPAHPPGLNMIVCLEVPAVVQLWNSRGQVDPMDTWLSTSLVYRVFLCRWPGSKSGLSHCPCSQSPTGQACTLRRGRSFLSASLSALVCKRPINAMTDQKAALKARQRQMEKEQSPARSCPAMPLPGCKALSSLIYRCFYLDTGCY